MILFGVEMLKTGELKMLLLPAEKNGRETNAKNVSQTVIWSYFQSVMISIPYLSLGYLKVDQVFNTLKNSQYRCFSISENCIICIICYTMKSRSVEELK